MLVRISPKYSIPADKITEVVAYEETDYGFRVNIKYISKDEMLYIEIPVASMVDADSYVAEITYRVNMTLSEKFKNITPVTIGDQTF